MTTGLAAAASRSTPTPSCRGLHRTDDRNFVGAFQAMDRAIVNP
jgi:hypothetical protein